MAGRTTTRGSRWLTELTKLAPWVGGSSRAYKMGISYSKLDEPREVRACRAARRHASSAMLHRRAVQVGYQGD
jgi:hypothetical protein